MLLTLKLLTLHLKNLSARLGAAIEGINVNVRSAFTVAFTFRSAFLALNAAANACERESMRGCARGVR